MNRTLDPGHKYMLFQLDAEVHRDFMAQILTFVKRQGLGFPGNTSAYRGTTLQAVMHAMIDRIEYLDKQIKAWENQVIIDHLCESLWLLEHRAARRHGWAFPYQVWQMKDLPACGCCGHVVCPQLKNAKRKWNWRNFVSAIYNHITK